MRSPRLLHSLGRHPRPLPSCARCGHFSAPVTPPLSPPPPSPVASSPASSPLVRPFDASHFSSPSWSTLSLLPAPDAAPLPPSLLPHLASLSSLTLSPASLPSLSADISRIIAWIALIQPVPTEGVEPLVSPLQLMGEDTCRLREDEAKATNGREEVMANARWKDRGFFVVPKVVDVGE